MKTFLSILLLSLGSLSLAAAQTNSATHDAEFFHPAASLYIQGDSTSASNLVAKGLSLYPDDGKLKRLKELLDQQQEQEQQKKDQQQQQKPENNPEQNQEQEQEKQNQEKPSNPDKEQQQSQPSEPQSAEQMSKDEARQLLDAMRQEEQNKRLQLHPVMGAPVKVDKDW